MRRLTITPDIDSLAKQYRVKMLYKKPKDRVVSRACKNLRCLKERIENDDYHPQDATLRYGDYLEKIEGEYEQLLILHPKDFADKANEFDAIIKDDRLSSGIEIRVDKEGNRLGNARTVAFYELVVWALRYDYVQGSVFPEIIRTLGIRTCVYCNAQYAISTHEGEAFYQLDHCYPKSKYPFLATNFFNLQPCCGACNQRKSGEDMRRGDYDVSMWKEATDPNDSYFNFHIEDGSLAKYMTNHERKDLDIDVEKSIDGDEDLDELLELFHKKFRTKEVYSEHREEAEEIIWKKYVYAPAYVDSLRVAFNGEFLDKACDFGRLLLGTYTKAEDVYKRPLTKMIQDIAKQLNIKIADE